MRRSRLLILLGAVVLLASLQTGAGAAGFRTRAAPMLDPAPGSRGTSVKALITVGDRLGPYLFEGIPDGVGLIDNGDGTADVFVTHEQSRVPFPVATATAGGLRDFSDSSISRLTIDLATREILAAETALSAPEGFIRFCSAFLAGPAEGFSNPVFFANEESDDDLPVVGSLYGADPFFAPANTREAGFAVYLDVGTGAYDAIQGMGRFNHENTVVVPGGWADVVTLSGDDTFNAPSSQLYLYRAATPDALIADQGSLFAFRVTATQEGPVDPADPFNEANDYGDIVVGDDWEGEFIPVPDGIADGTDPGTPPLAPQAALERWSNENNAFQFIRVEDLAYDRNEPNVVYFADTGERRARPDLDPSDLDPPDGRLDRAPSTFNGPYPNGRIFRIEFDPADPLRVLSFSILLDNDPGGLNNPAVMHQPDNIDTSTRSLMVQEDSGQAPFSRIWRYDFASQTWSVVASVQDQLWESSGIVDASAIFGPGTWLVTVQAHNVFEYADGPIAGLPNGPITGGIPNTTTAKREGGQLVLLRVRNS